MNSLQIQGMIFAALSTNTALDSLLARARTITGATLTTPAIYDNVPQGVYADDSAFPYVVIGNDTENEWNTDNSTGSDASVEIHVWSRQMGRSEAKTVQAAIFNALNRQDLVITGRNVVNVEQQTALSMVDPDGKTRHGVQTFRVVVDS